jgi:hypothetical protein
MNFAAVWAIITDLAMVDGIQHPKAEHVDQFEIVELVANCQTESAMKMAFYLS